MFNYFVSFVSYHEGGKPSGGSCKVQVENKVNSEDSTKELVDLLKLQMSAEEIVILNIRSLD